MPKTMTLGQLMLSDLLPGDLYQPGMAVNKGKLKSILGEIAQRDPEGYPEIAYRLMRLGLKTGESSGGASFGIKDLLPSAEIKAKQQEIRQESKRILDSHADPVARAKALTAYLRTAAKEMPDYVYEDSKKNDNRFALQLEGAGRGNRGSLGNLRAGSVMVENSSGDGIPIPITNSYSQGQTLGQHLASAYGGRTGITQTKLAVGSSGYLSKLLQQGGHRLVVVGEDDDNQVGDMRGLLVDAADEENVGALLAKDYGEFEKNTPITPAMLTKLHKLGKGKILIRSPITSSSLDGGVFGRDVGVREFGRLARRGEHVGMPSSQAIGEQVTQAALGAKHVGGASQDRSGTPGLRGFDLVERLINPPKEGRGLAAHATLDGKVKKIRSAPQGGQYVTIGEKEHYVAPDFEVAVKLGDTIEAGDVISNGIPDPSEITKHKGIGEGRKYLVESMRRGLNEAGFPVARRNLELLARGLVDRVQIDDGFGDFTPGSTVSYSRVEKLYRPRKDAVDTPIESAEGKYLEVPSVHYTIGSRITPSVIKNLSEAGVRRIAVHKQPPPFSPLVTRAADVLQTDPDFMTQQLGSHLKRGLTQAAQFGGESDEDSTSFVPVRAAALNLGRTGLTLS